MEPNLSNSPRAPKWHVLVVLIIVIPVILYVITYDFRRALPIEGVELKHIKDIPTSMLYPQILIASDDGSKVLLGDNGWDQIVMISFDTNSISKNLVDIGWDYTSAAFSPDINRLAIAESSDASQSVGKNTRIRILSSQNLSTVDTIWAGDRLVQCMCFSPDSRRIAVADKAGRVTVWDINTSKEIANYDGSAHATSYVGAQSIAYSSDSELLAVGIENSLLILNSDSLDVRMHNDYHKYAIMSVAFSKDSSILATATTDKSLCIWNMSDGSLRNSFSTANTASVKVALQGDNVIVVGSVWVGEREVQGIVDLLLVSEGKRLRILEPSKRFTLFASTTRSHFLYGVDEEGIVRQWTVRDNRQ